MAKLRAVSGKSCIKVLCNNFGFIITGRTGSHVRLEKEIREGKIGTVVPLHKELKIGTLKGVLRLAGISQEEFEMYI